ncbi:MAG TPA: DegQ family serine endoprotease [Roseateles sp.]|nr:DegQ family serine endoprotease [Roseateles sp.]
MIPARRLVWALTAAGLIGLGGGAVGAVALTRTAADAMAAPAPAGAAPAAAAAPLAQPGAAMLPDFAQITTKNGPAVVNISVTGTLKTASRRGQQQMPQLDPDDPFYQFFRRFQMPGQPDQQPRETPMRGQGSGFIVSEDGIILTNAHVVRDAQEVMVKLTDRREFPAKVLGSDAKTDVAVLKIEARNLPTLKLGSTQDLRVGEWVLAIGSPFGFENSVSAGVVSAKGRALPDESFVPFIQTDVAVNPGNSGGPLFNARGEVVGINSQIYSQSGGYQGISFAIPIEVAKRVQQQIQSGGRAQHARLGLVIQDVNQAFADSFKLERPAGALVSSVEEGGPAAKAGLKSGDVILKFNEQPINASSDLPALLGQATPGETAKLEVWRQGQRETLSARLGDATEKGAAKLAQDETSPAGKLGLALRPLEPGEGGARVKGLVVEDVAGAAARAGVQPGDLLLAVNGTPVRSVEQVREVVAGAQKSVALLVQRGGQQIFLPVRLG